MKQSTKSMQYHIIHSTDFKIHTRPLMACLVILSFLLFPANNVLALEDGCGFKLGRNYDQQTAEVKMARLAVYFDCRLKKDYQIMQGRYKAALRAIDKWRNRTNSVINSSLQIKGKIAAVEVKTGQQSERAEAEANYLDQIAAIDAPGSTEEKDAANKKRRELYLVYRNDTKAMRSHHRVEYLSVQGQFRECRANLGNQIKRMTLKDENNVRQQFLDKSSQLTREIEDLKATPMNMSPNKYANSRPKTTTSSGGTGDGDSSAPPPAASAEASASGSTASNSENDAAIGTIENVEGSVSVIRPSGETDKAYPGMPIYLGDVVETEQDSAFNMVFVDESTIDLGEKGRLEIDEYIYDPEAESGKSRFSLMRGIFVFTSDLIGSKEPRDVDIDINPRGGIGIRG